MKRSSQSLGFLDGDSRRDRHLAAAARLTRLCDQDHKLANVAFVYSLPAATRCGRVSGVISQSVPAPHVEYARSNFENSVRNWSQLVELGSLGYRLCSHQLRTQAPHRQPMCWQRSASGANDDERKSECSRIASQRRSAPTTYIPSRRITRRASELFVFDLRPRRQHLGFNDCKMTVRRIGRSSRDLSRRCR